MDIDTLSTKSTKITILIRPPEELLITLTDNSVRCDSQFLPSWPPETSLLFCHLDRVSVQPIQGGLTRGKYSNQPENETMKMLNGCYNTEWQGIRGMSLESESKSKFSIPQSPYWAFLWPVCVCPFSCAPSDSVRQIRTLSVLILSRMGWRWWWSGMYFVNQPTDTPVQHQQGFWYIPVFVLFETQNWDEGGWSRYWLGSLPPNTFCLHFVPVMSNLHRKSATVVIAVIRVWSKIFAFPPLIVL